MPLETQFLTLKTSPVLFLVIILADPVVSTHCLTKLAIIRLIGGGTGLERYLFVFQTDGGTDTINCYEDGVDRIQFHAIVGTFNFAALRLPITAQAML